MSSSVTPGSETAALLDVAAVGANPSVTAGVFLVAALARHRQHL